MGVSTDNLLKDLRNERFYAVEAKLQFRLDNENISGIELLAIIDKADAMYPWKDGPLSGTNIKPTLAARVLVTRGFYEFSITPVGKSIKKGQLYGFEKYAFQLATNIRNQKIPNLIEIRVQVTTRLEFEYKRES